MKKTTWRLHQYFKQNVFNTSSLGIFQVLFRLFSCSWCKHPEDQMNTWLKTFARLHHWVFSGHDETNMTTTSIFASKRFQPFPIGFFIGHDEHSLYTIELVSSKWWRCPEFWVLNTTHRCPGIVFKTLPGHSKNVLRIRPKLTPGHFQDFFIKFFYGHDLMVLKTE